MILILGYPPDVCMEPIKEEPTTLYLAGPVSLIIVKFWLNCFGEGTFLESVNALPALKQLCSIIAFLGEMQHVAISFIDIAVCVSVCASLVNQRKLFDINPPFSPIL